MNCNSSDRYMFLARIIIFVANISKFPLWKRSGDFKKIEGLMRIQSETDNRRNNFRFLSVFVEHREKVLIYIFICELIITR